MSFYVLVSAQLICMVTLHSLFQPYKQRAHNLVDSLVFANLLLLNSLSAFNYELISSESRFPDGLKSVAIYIQSVLMYLPLVYIVCYCVRKFFTKLKPRCKGYVKVTSEDLDDDLPQLRSVAD